MNKIEQLDVYLKNNSELNIFEKTSENGLTSYSSMFDVDETPIAITIIPGEDSLTEVICRVLTLDNDQKETELLYAMNESNQLYKAAKYTLVNSKDLNLIMSYVATDENFEPGMLMLLVSNAMAIVEEDYNEFERIIEE